MTDMLLFILFWAFGIIALSALVTLLYVVIFGIWFVREWDKNEGADDEG